MVVASGCGYDGGYRYPCQDPDNWGTHDCLPPNCSVWGTCPEMLVYSCGTRLGSKCRNV